MVTAKTLFEIPGQKGKYWTPPMNFYQFQYLTNLLPDLIQAIQTEGFNPAAVDINFIIGFFSKRDVLLHLLSGIILSNNIPFIYYTKCSECTRRILDRFCVFKINQFRV